MARHGTVSRAKGMSGVSLTPQKGLAIVVLLGLAACAEPEVILPGERIDVATGQPVGSAPVQRVVPFSAPAARANAGWTHRAGTPAGDLVNPALGPVTGRIWSAPIGQGERRGHRITAQPVVAAGGSSRSIPRRGSRRCPRGRGALDAWTSLRRATGRTRPRAAGSPSPTGGSS
jgi:hypothetical protein